MYYSIYNDLTQSIRGAYDSHASADSACDGEEEFPCAVTRKGIKHGGAATLRKYVKQEGIELPSLSPAKPAKPAAPVWSGDSPDDRLLNAIFGDR
mgnify:CR=1 FL=1